MIEQLDNNEQILLMYLADELPAADRLEVEQMLAAEPSFRSALERLGDQQQAVNVALAALDEASPLPANVEALVRQIGRDLRQRMINRAVTEQSAHLGQSTRAWRWALPTAAAAAVVVATAVWISRHGQAPGTMPDQNPQLVQRDHVAPESEPDRITGPTTPPISVQGDSGYAMLVDSFSPLAADFPEYRVAPDDSQALTVPSDETPPVDDISQSLLGAASGAAVN